MQFNLFVVKKIYHHDFHSRICMVIYRISVIYNSRMCKKKNENHFYFWTSAPMSLCNPTIRFSLQFTKFYFSISVICFVKILLRQWFLYFWGCIFLILYLDLKNTYSKYLVYTAFEYFNIQKKRSFIGSNQRIDNRFHIDSPLTKRKWRLANMPSICYPRKYSALFSWRLTI